MPNSAGSDKTVLPALHTLDTSQPCWADYGSLLQDLQRTVVAPGELPGTQHLQALLPADAQNLRGLPIRFCPSSLLPAGSYEQRIFQTGEVSTRANQWHDLFNALVWCRFTRLKAALNTAHCAHMELHHGDLPHGRGRGTLRDALTLFDESGAIVVSTSKGLLNALAARDWNEAFVQHKSLWREEVLVFVCGHSVLEKFLRPYKALTAHALLVHIDAQSAHTPRENVLQNLDSGLAGALAEGRILRSTSDLSPLPLMGIPGWWPEAQQDAGFYADRQVFRPARARQRISTVLDFSSYHVTP